MVKRIFWTTLFIVFGALLQSTLLYRLSFNYAIPDLALIILIFSAYTNGAMEGQFTGISGGLFIDFVSFSPFGLNMFIRTVIGFVFGKLKGNFFLDPIFLPMVLCLTGTFLKAGLLVVLSFLFKNAILSYSFSKGAFWIELLLNTILAPFIFSALKYFSALIVKEKRNAHE
jgi:rod shape-determining protein MreD